MSEAPTSKDESLVESLRTGDKILSAAAPLTYTDHVMRRAADEIERLTGLLTEYASGPLMAPKQGWLIDGKKVSSDSALSAFVAHAVGCQAEIERLDKDLTEALTERDWAQDCLQATHVALGGDGEWAGKLPPEMPPDSGDLHYDVPALATERMAEIERLRTAMRYWVALPIWRPIDTAPQGGLPILITDGSYITEAWRRGGGWEATCDGYIFADACYWMPIPMIPKRPDSETKDSP